MFINTLSAQPKNLFIPQPTYIVPPPVAIGAWDFATSSCLNTVSGGSPGPLNLQGISGNDIWVEYTASTHSYSSSGGFSNGPCIYSNNLANALSRSQFSSPVDFSNGVIISGCINFVSPRYGRGPYIILNDTSVGATTNFIFISFGQDNASGVLFFGSRFGGVTNTSYQLSSDVDTWVGGHEAIIATNGVPTFFVVTIEFLATTQVVTCYQSGRSVTWRIIRTNLLPSYFTHMDQLHISSYSIFGASYNQSYFDNICLFSGTADNDLLDFLLAGNMP